MTRHLRPLAALAAATLLAAVLPGATSADAAPGDDPMYRPLHGFRPSGPHVRVQPEQDQAFRVTTSAVRASLPDAPRAGAPPSTESPVPPPTGGVERFAVQRTSVLSPELAAANPDIRTWAG